MSILIFFILNFCIAYSAFLLVYKWMKIKGAVDSVLALFTVYLAQIIAIELMLGMFGRLNLINIVILVFIAVSLVHLLTRNMPYRLPKAVFAGYLDGILANKLYAFIFSVVAAFLLVKITVNLYNPPFGWDSLNYHFTFAVEWLKNGNLNTPITIFDDISPTYYPLNGSLFYLWLIFPFKSVFMADLGQLPFFIIAVISVYGVSRKIGLSKLSSFYAALLFMLIPNFFKQLQIAYVDVMVGALFLVCVNYLLLLKQDFCLKNVLIYSLSFGLLIGVKTTALPFSVLLVLPFFALWFKNPRKIHLGLIFVVCVICLGGFSYIRNFVETGNPLYPLDFSFLGMEIFKGVMARQTYAGHFIAWDYSLGKMLFHEGLGAQALLLILPGIFLALPLTFIKKRKDLSLNFVYFLLLPVLIYLVYRYIVPLANVRYLYAMMGLGIIFGFYLLELLDVKRLAVNLLVIICIFSSIPSLAKRQELVVSLALSVVFFLALVNFKKIKTFRNKRVSLYIIVILALGLFIFGEKYYNGNEFARYYKMVKYSGFWPDAAKAWGWLNKETGSGANIAYTGRAVPFPLYGSGFKNNVYYVSVNKTQPAKVHYFNNSKYEYAKGFESLLKSIEEENNYRGNADYNIWLENLFKSGADYLFVYSLQQAKSTIFPLEDNWAMLNPDKFTPVFTNNTIHIYRIIR